MRNIFLDPPPISKLKKFKKYVTGLPGMGTATSAYWPLNETSGSALNQEPTTKGQYNGTVSNVTQGQSGLNGKSYSFDGNGDRVIITGFVPAATFSFAFLLKRNGTPDANDRIIDQASGGPTRGWHVQFDADGNVGLRTWNNGGAALSLNYGIVADLEWNVISASVGASETKLYLNGVEVATGGGNSFGSGVVADLQFGARSGGTSNASSFFMQHVAVASGVEWTAAQHARFSSFFLT